MDLTERLDAMEAAIRKPSFRQSSGKANEVNYWIFDYPPEKELEVRERIEYMKHKNSKGTDGFELVVFDLYDIIIDFLEGKNFIEKCCEFEKKRGIQRIVKAVSNSMKVSEDDSLIVQYILDHTPENAHLGRRQSRAARLLQSFLQIVQQVMKASVKAGDGPGLFAENRVLIR